MQFETYHNYSTITTDLAFGLAAIIGIALSAVMAWKGRWDWAIFSLFGVLLPLSTNTYSMIRFVVGLAPILITAALLLSRWKWLFYLVLPAMLIADVFLLPAWTGAQLLHDVSPCPRSTGRSSGTSSSSL